MSTAMSVHPPMTTSLTSPPATAATATTASQLTLALRGTWPFVPFPALVDPTAADAASVARATAPADTLQLPLALP
jgi:hypothetical protein